jgi:hypothetical protein
MKLLCSNQTFKPLMTVVRLASDLRGRTLDVREFRRNSVAD